MYPSPFYFPSPFPASPVTSPHTMAGFLPPAARSLPFGKLLSGLGFNPAMGGGMMGGGGMGPAMMGAAQGGGIMPWIQSAQKMLGMMQTVTPMVRQYGPIVRQLPAIWKVMNSSPPANPSEEAEPIDKEETASSPMTPTTQEIPVKWEEKEVSSSYSSTVPRPKLYI
ncbi:VrrA/YqfQ family protein [Bacillus sp. FJAT-44742]|uniref:VrrA/YqfQ family protein n=1 Tax=Bacillus sp. FJAT-44742 TaxID=2014005 RepID=UPI000C23FAE3|nr:VrrA/YqfQ family protein [Bacillus sp. FJAT-44742]